MTTQTDETVALGRTAWGALESLHVVGYFAPEVTTAYTDLGLHPRLSYFAARSAAFGPAGPELVTATFYVFAPWLAHKALPAAWEVASPDQVQTARREGVLTALRGVLGTPDVTEALRLARTACEALDSPGRPLYAAHRELDWPEDELLALWHAATLVREHRGDGHVAVLTTTGLDPVESLVLGGLFSHNTDFLRSTRGWSEPEWDAAQARLGGRGLLTESGELSTSGRELRQELEDRTDDLARGGWDHLGADGTRRLGELLAPLRQTILDSGVLPGWISARA